MRLDLSTPFPIVPCCVSSSRRLSFFRIAIVQNDHHSDFERSSWQDEICQVARANASLEEQLPRVHDALRVNGVLERAHKLDAALAKLSDQQTAFADPDTVLTR